MIESKYQTFWRRSGAGLIDGLIFLPLGLIDPWKLSIHIPIFILITWYIIHETAWYFYSVLMHGRYGQTLGKMAFNVKVVDKTEAKPITYRQAFYRDGILIVTGLIFALMILPEVAKGKNPYDLKETKQWLSILIWSSTSTLWFAAELITMLTNKKRRAIHDFIAGSIVIKTEKTISKLWSWSAIITAIICFISFIAWPTYKAYQKKVQNIDTNKTSQNIVSLLKPEKNFPYIGFWKKDCKSSVGLAIDKADDGKYSVSLCRPEGCYKPGTYMPNISLIEDQKYRIIDKNTIEIAIADDYYWRYYRCSP